MPTELDPAGTAVPIGSWTTSTGGTPGDGLFILFGGMLYDAAAGLYLTKTRAYNPKTGRFLQRDILDEDAKDGYDGFPFGKDAIGTNLYARCGNNPVSRVDPMGTFSFSDLIRRGAQAVRSIARGIGAGYSGASSGGYGGAYGFGYRIGSGARAGAKMVAAAVEAVKPLVTVRTAVAARAPSKSFGTATGSINSERDLGFVGNHIRKYVGSGFGETLFENYWTSGGDIELTTGRFKDIVNSCSRVGDMETVALSNGQWGKKQQLNCNTSSEYATAIGTATVYLGKGAVPVGFSDTYNFDPHGSIFGSDRSAAGEAATQAVWYASALYPHADFDIYYGATETH